MKASNKQGFTLIELLLVIALLSITVGITTNIIVSVTRSYTKTQVANELEQNANFLLLKIEKDLRNATDVTVTSDRLEIKNNDGVDIVYTVLTSPSSRYVTRSVGGGSAYTITNRQDIVGVDVTCPDSGRCFQLITSNPTVVKLDLLFQQRGSSSGVPNSFTGSLRLQNTIVARGTY